MGWAAPSACRAAACLTLLLFCRFPEDLKIVPLDYSQLSQRTTLPKKLVKECVNDIVVLFSWGAGLGEDYDLVFKGIGFLMSRNKILTMRYYEDFLLTIDGTGMLLNCLLSVSLTLFPGLLGGLLRSSQRTQELASLGRPRSAYDLGKGSL